MISSRLSGRKAWWSAKSQARDSFHSFLTGKARVRTGTWIYSQH